MFKFSERVHKCVMVKKVKAIVYLQPNLLCIICSAKPGPVLFTKHTVNITSMLSNLHVLQLSVANITPLKSILHCTRISYVHVCIIICVVWDTFLIINKKNSGRAQ